MKKGRKAEDVLIVAADFKPEENGRLGARQEVINFAKKIKGTGVYIKINSILRACGYDLIDNLHDLGLKVVADLKLKDIPETMEIDAMFLTEAKPEIITVLCDASVEGMLRVKEQLKGSGSEILGVTVLTSLDEDECQAIYVCSTKAGVVRLARLAENARLDGLVLAAEEIGVIRKRRELDNFSLNTPAIRPEWTIVGGDDQAKKRIKTPAQAIEMGVDRIIVGRPITRNKDPQSALLRTLSEIEVALEKLKLSE